MLSHVRHICSVPSPYIAHPYTKLYSTPISQISCLTPLPWLLLQHPPYRRIFWANQSAAPGRVRDKTALAAAAAPRNKTRAVVKLFGCVCARLEFFCCCCRFVTCAPIRGLCVCVCMGGGVKGNPKRHCCRGMQEGVKGRCRVAKMHKMPQVAGLFT